MQGNRSVVIGNNAGTENTGSVVIGDGARASGGGGVSVGQESFNNNGWASALGFQSRAEGGNSTSIGAKSRTAGQNAGAFGFQASASGSKAYAVGTDAVASNEGSLALGSSANASANLAQAIGWGAQSSGTSATAIGVGSNSSGQSSLAIGHNAAVTTTKNVSLGADSTDAGTSTEAGLSFATDLSGVTGTPNAVVSVGKADFTRKISYVGAGVADTDAVNVAQLKSLADNKLSLTADGNTRTNKIALGVAGQTSDERLSLGIIGDGSYIKTEATGNNVKVSFNAAKMAKNSPTVYVNGDGEIVAQGTDGKFYPIKDLNDDGTPKQGATAVPESDLKVVTNTPKAAGDNTTTANTPNDLNGIKSALNVPNLDNVNNNDTAAPAITPEQAKTAVAGNDNNGTGGLYAIQGGNNLLKAVNLGDLQAVAKAGANYKADKANTVVNRPLGTAMAFVTGVDADGSADFAAADGSSNLGTIISTTDNKISFVMKKKPTFEGLTLSKDGNTVNMDPTADGLNMGGSKITNIGDGEISATSTDAITGKQVAGLKHNITSNDSTITVSNNGALFENNVDLSIANGAITADKLAANAVTADKIAANAITGDKIQNGTITADKLAAGVISGDSLTAGAVDADKLAENAVTGDKIENGAVGTDKLANNAVDSSKLADNAVTESKIAPNAVTSNKIAQGAVTSDKLGAGAVTTEKLGNGAVTGEKIANGTITADKIAADAKGNITSNTLTVTDGTGRALGGNVTIELKQGGIDEDKLNQDLKDKLANIATNATNIAGKLDATKAQFNIAGDDTNTTHNVNLNTAAVPTVQVKGDNSTISVTLDNGALKVAAQTASTKEAIDDPNNAGKLATAGGVKNYVEDKVATKLDSSKAKFKIAGDEGEGEIDLTQATEPTLTVDSDNDDVLKTKAENGKITLSPQVAKADTAENFANDGNKLATSAGVQKFVAGQGLNFMADSTVATDKILTTLGNTLNIKTGTAIDNSNQNQFRNDNLGTKIDVASSTISVEMKKDIKVDTVTIGGNADTTKNTKLGVDADGNILINPNDTNNAKEIRGLAKGTQDDSAVNLKQLNTSLDDLNNRINYLNEGSAGNVVYTDDEGERVTPVRKDGQTTYYYIKDIVNAGLKQVVEKQADGSEERVYYDKAEYDKWKNGGSTTTKPTPVKIAEKLAGKEVADNKVGLSTVNGDGSTKNPEQLGNIASALDLDNMNITKENSDSVDDVLGKVKKVQGLAPINPDGKPNLDNIAKAKEAIAGDDGKGGIYGVNGRDLYKATTLGDLQAVAAAGLTFNANETVTGTNDDPKNIHRPLGTFINIIGKEIPTKVDYDVATHQGNYTAENIITTIIKDRNTIQIKFKDNPEFGGVDLVNRDDKGNVTEKINMTLGGANGDTLVLGAGTDPANNKPVSISGVKENPDDPNSVLTRESLKGIDDQIDKKIDDFGKGLKDQIDDIAQGANAGTASAMAAAGVPQVISINANHMLGVGVGAYGGEKSIAIGYTATNDNRDKVYRVTGTFNSKSKIGLSAGIGFTFGKRPTLKDGIETKNSNYYQIIQNQQMEIENLKSIQAASDLKIAELTKQVEMLLEKIK